MKSLSYTTDFGGSSSAAPVRKGRTNSSSSLRLSILVLLGLIFVFSDGTGLFGVENLIEGNAMKVQDAEAADVDGDGDLDVLSVQWQEDQIVWYNNTNGDSLTWVQIQIYYGLDAPRELAIADFDDDGDVDVAAVSEQDASLRWFENNGDGSSWTTHLVSDSLRGVYGIFAGDIDGDGDIDIATAAQLDDLVSFWKNDGTGSFTHYTVSTTVTGPLSVGGGDLDGDGDMDLVSGGWWDDELAWHENVNGDGTVWTTVLYETINGPYRCRVADIDGDGDNDTIVVSSANARIRWYENDGTATTFTQHTITSKNEIGLSIAIGDLDGDGDLDVGSNSYADDHLTWYDNRNGDGSSWKTYVVHDDSWGASSAAFADMDGDGDLDFVAGASLNFDVSWYENFITESPTVEFGEVTLGASWTTVTYQTNIARPGVFFSPLTYTDRFDTAHSIRVKEITSTSFKAKVTNCSGGIDQTFDVNFFVFEERSYHNGAIQMEILEVVGISSTFSSVTFENSFSATPGVIAFIQTTNGDYFAHSRVKSVTTTGFDVKIEYDSTNPANVFETETVTYFAFDVSTTGTLDVISHCTGDLLTFAVETGTQTNVQHIHKDVVYTSLSSYTNVLFNGDSNTFNGDHAATLSLADISTSTKAVVFEHEMDCDTGETGHANAEDIAYFALGSSSTDTCL